MSKRVKKWVADESWRREDAAFAVIKILQRDRHQDFTTFADKVNDEKEFRKKSELSGEWCSRMGLRSDWVSMAALHLALDPNDGPVGRVNVSVWADDEGNVVHPDQVTWRRGETKKGFLARAAKVYDWMKQLDETEGGVPDYKPVNRQHLEWLIDFQVTRKSMSVVSANAKADPKDVRAAIRAAAKLLELPLRQHPPGRPKGRKDSRPRRKSS